MSWGSCVDRFGGVWLGAAVVMLIGAVPAARAALPTCAEAQAVATFPYTNIVERTFGTSEVSSRDCSATDGPAVWYRFEVPEAGELEINTAGSSVDTMVRAYSGTCNAFHPEGCNDNDGVSTQSVITVRPDGPAVYYVAVSAVSPSAVPVRIVVSASFTKAFDVKPLGPFGGALDALEIDLDNPNRMYAAAAGTLFRSDNEGATWNVRSRALPFVPQALAIATDVPNRLYIAARSSGIFRSDDDGVTWSRINGAAGAYRFRQLVPLGSDGTALLVIAESGPDSVLFITRDGGATLQIPDVPGGCARSVALAAAARTPSDVVVLASDTGFVCRSQDAGVTWTASPANLPSEANDLAVGSGNPPLLYAVDGCLGRFGGCDPARLVRSADFGVSWTELTQVGLRPDRAIDDRFAMPLLAGHALHHSLFVLDGTVLRGSSDEFTSSAPLGSGLNRLSVQSAREGGTRLFAAGPNGPLVSDNGGATWVAGGTPNNSAGPMATSADGARVYLASGILYVNSAGGDPTAWSSRSLGASVTSVAADPTDARSAFAGTISGMFRSVDGGVTWQAAGLSGVSINTIVIDRASPRSIYTLTSAGLQRSRDLGASWQPVSTPLTPTFLAVDGSSPSRIVVAAPGGIFRSEDGGIVWKPITSGIPDSLLSGITALSAPSDVPDTLLVLLAGNIYVSTRFGNYWSPISAPAGTRGLSAGTRRVYLHTAEDSLLAFVAAHEALRVDTVSSSAGPVSGGSVTITGRHFNPGTTRAFVGDVEAAMTVINETTAIVTMPAHAAGRVPLVVSDGVMRAQVPAGFTYLTAPSIASVTPAAASPSADVEVRITGANFVDGLTKVLVDRSVAHITSVTPNEIVGTVAGGEFDAGWTQPPGMNMVVTAAAASLDVPGVAFAGTATGEIHKSVDAGETWAQVASWPGSGAVRRIVAHPLRPGVYYAATGAGLQITLDGGAHWALADPSRAAMPVSSVAILRTSPATILYRANDFGFVLIESRDDGASWRENTWFPYYADGSQVLAEAPPLVPHATNPNIVYGPSRDLTGMHYSSDAGRTWSLKTFQTFSFVPAFVQDAAGFRYAALSAPDAPFESAFPRGIFRSDPVLQDDDYDGVNTGLTDLDVRTLAADRRLASALYAATPSGMFKTVNGESWRSVNAPFTPLTPRDMTVDAVAGVVYLATERGLFVARTARRPGVASVTVITPGGSAIRSSAVTFVGPPTITAVTPSSAHVFGGTQVTITGSGFVPGAAVTFAGKPAASVNFVSASTLVVRTPSGAAGSAPLAITTPSGSAAAAFTFTTATPLTVTLSRTAPSPLRAGMAVSFAARASDGPAAEYKFWLRAGGTWSVLREYSAAPSLQWTPSAAGSYLVQVWVRRVSATVDVEGFASSEFDVAAAAPARITGVTTPPPVVAAGSTITWTTAASDGVPPLQYRYWRQNLSTGAWSIARDYSMDPSYSWVTTDSDAGRYRLQVWVRGSGSTAEFEAWNAIEPIEVASSVPHMTGLDIDGTLTTGAVLTIRARAAGPELPHQFRFWLRENASGAWTLLGEYSAADAVQWTPERAGTYTLQAWVRRPGSSASFEDWMTREITVAPSARAAYFLTIDRRSPIAPGTSVTLRAGAGPEHMEYRFWVYQAGIGWRSLRDYDASASALWTPTEAGEYYIQVWGRRPGSSESYEVWRASDVITVAMGPATLHRVTVNQTFALKAGTPITWTLDASGGSAPLLYQCWLYDVGAGRWEILRAFAPMPSCSWTPPANRLGTFVLQAWIRSTGSAVDLEDWKATDPFEIKR